MEVFVVSATEAWSGRPVDVIVVRDGSLYVSDDSRQSKGAIYRVTWTGK